MIKNNKKGKFKQINQEKNNSDCSFSDENEVEVKEKPLSRSDINELICKAKNTESVLEIIELSKNSNPQVRLKAIQRLCPCRVLDDIKIFWDRIFEMVTDEDAKVRYQILHNMCDGSPPEYESRVVEALDVFNKDSDKEVRRRAHKVMGSYLKTGKLNVL